MFDGIDDIDWGSLTHAYGPADDVPGLLRSLASSDEKTREDARKRCQEPFLLTPIQSIRVHPFVLVKQGGRGWTERSEGNPGAAATHLTTLATVS